MLFYLALKLIVYQLLDLAKESLLHFFGSHQVIGKRVQQPDKIPGTIHDHDREKLKMHGLEQALVDPVGPEVIVPG